MRLAATLAILASISIFAQRVPIPGDTESSLEQGVEMFQTGKYLEAIAAFQKAVDFDPNDAMGHLYLGIAHTTQYNPGMPSPESAAHGQQARAEFLRALEIAPANKPALQYLASLSMREAQVTQDQAEKNRKLDEARDWYLKVVALDPKEKDAYFSIATIDWMKLTPDLMNARTQIGMRPDEMGPLRDPAVRQTLKAKYGAVIEDGISNLTKALEIDPQYEPAMTYMNLMVRARADLRDSAAEYQSDIKAAETWVQKSADNRSSRINAQRIRTAQPPRLLTRVEPVYPPLAKQARVQGTVRFTAIIGKDGRVQNLQLVSGHPLLVSAAQDAVKQWIYKATVFNGEPVEVVTQVDVNFTLPGKDEKSRDRASAAATNGK